MPFDRPLDAPALYELLFAAYGPQHWWPAETPLEVVVGAVLTQNTAWRNVAVAIANLKEQGLLAQDTLLAAPVEVVKAAIRPSGFYNVKYERLRNVLTFLAARGGIAGAQTMPGEALRAELLAVPGVGPETADSILLYALHMPTFVVDAYTRRLLGRLGLEWAQGASYDEVQAWFMQALPRAVAQYGEYHALLVRHGKEHCRRSPLCDRCPLAESCPANNHGPQEVTLPLQPARAHDV